MEGIKSLRLAERLIKDFALEETITKEELENQILLNIEKVFVLLRDNLKECLLEKIAYFVSILVDKMNFFKEEEKKRIVLCWLFSRSLHYFRRK